MSPASSYKERKVADNAVGVLALSFVTLGMAAELDLIVSGVSGAMASGVVRPLMAPFDAVPTCGNPLSRVV